MEQRRLGTSGLSVSAIGLGGNTFGATVDGDEAVRTIRHAIDQGITFIDTADVYSMGRSEELVGQAIAGRRESVVVATKCGIQLNSGPHAGGLSRRWVTQAAEALGLGIIPYTPLASGILTGKYRRGAEPEAGTRMGDLEGVRGRLTDDKLARAERVTAWAKERGHTPAEAAIAWLLAHPVVPSVIAGARRPEQIEANIKAAAWTMTPEERDELTSLVAIA
jgi:aryl-alcohol dehydrogenase-like predicted oxidoreductase